MLSTTGRAMAASAAVLVVAGVAVLVFADGTTRGFLATVLLGVAGVLVVSLVFLTIGEGEDRERDLRVPD